jgi:phosphoribosylanthranilate isomerase
MPVRVKICGLTSAADALAAVEAGADALGFMLCPRSKRYVTPEAVSVICRELPPFVARVGVFVDAAEDDVRRIAQGCGLSALQFHGGESPAYCGNFGQTPVVKAFRVADQHSLAVLPSFAVSAWLLDSYVAGELGGTGECFNWDLAVTARTLGRPIILAGGLTPENVAEAVRQVEPWAVDVSSGVEFAPGRKDPAKLRAFVAAAKSAV